MKKEIGQGLQLRPSTSENVRNKHCCLRCSVQGICPISPRRLRWSLQATLKESVLSLSLNVKKKKWYCSFYMIPSILYGNYGGATGKDLPASAGDVSDSGSIPGSPWVGKISWRRKWHPLQYSCLENPMDRGSWRAIVHGVAESAILYICLEPQVIVMSSLKKC